VIETGGGVSGALRSVCSSDVPLRANRSDFAIAFGSCFLRYMAATGLVKLSKKFEIVINCWCCDCWLPSEPQRQLTSLESSCRSRAGYSIQTLGNNIYFATYLDLYVSVKDAVHGSEYHQVPAYGRASSRYEFCSVRRAVTCDGNAMARSNNATCMQWLTTYPSSSQ
jgi:hypothetical protein